MSKKRLNALLVAGCLTFLAPMSAHANDLEVDKTYSTSETLTTETDGTKFSTIIVNDTDAPPSTILTIDATNGSLTPNSDSAGSVTLNNTSRIELTNAVNDVIFTSTIVNGTNTFTYSSTIPSGKTETDYVKANLGDIQINSGTNEAPKSFTINAQAGETEANSLALNGHATFEANSTKAESNQSNGKITISDVTVSGSNNTIKNTTAISDDGIIEYGAIIVDASSAATTLTLENVKAANYDTIGTKEDTNNQDITYELKGSYLKETDVNAGQNVTVNGASGESTIDTITLTAGTAQNDETPADITTLNINANDGNIDQADGKQITLNDNTKLSLSEKTGSALSLEEVAIQNSANATISNSATHSGAEITTITIGDAATATLENLKYGNYTTTEIGSATTINLNNSELKTETSDDRGSEPTYTFKVNAGESITVKAVENSTDNNVAQTILEEGLTSGDNQTTTLTLEAAANSSLNVAGVTMNGNNALNINSSNITIGAVTTDGNQMNTITKDENVSTRIDAVALGEQTKTTLENIKKSNYDSLTLGNNAQVTLSNSELVIAEDVTARGIQVTSQETTVNKIQANDNVKFSSIVLEENSNTTLTNVKQGENKNYTAAIELNDNVTVNLVGSDLLATGTAQATGVNISGENNSISLDNINVKLGNINFAAESSATLNEVKETNYSTATIGNDTSVTLNNSALKIGGDDEVTGIDVAANGTSKIEIINSNAKLDGITLANDSTTTLKNVGANNYGTVSTTTLGGSATVNLEGSHFVGGQVNSGETLTINATSDVSTIGNVTLAAGTAQDGETPADITTLVLNKNNDAATLTQSGSTAITLNDNTALKTNTGGITLGNVKVTEESTSTIENLSPNNQFTITNITLGNGSETTLNKVNNTGTAVFEGNATVSLNNSKLAGISVDSDNKLTLNASGGSLTGAINLTAGTGGNGRGPKITELDLSCSDENASLNTGKITLNANTELNTSGSGNITVNGVEVNGDSSILNSGTGSRNFGDIVLQSGTLTTSGVTSSMYGDLILSGGNINNDGADTKLTTPLVVSSGVESTITATNGNIEFGTINLTAGTAQNGETPADITILTLNASQANITGLFQEGQEAPGSTTVTMAGYNQLNLNHASGNSIQLDNVEVTGGNNTVNNQASTSQSINTVTLKGGTLVLNDIVSETTQSNGAFAITNTISSAGNSDNTLTNNVADSNLGALTVADANLVINANANTDFSTANVSQNKTLTLNANGGNIASSGAATLSNANLVLNGTANNTVNLSGVNVTGGTEENNNFIGKQEGSDVTINLGAVNVQDDAYLTLQNITVNDYSGITLGDDSTINLDDSALNDPNLGNVTTTINGSNGRSTYGTITATESSSEKSTTITLSAADGATLTGELINAGQIGTTTVIDMTGDGKVTNGGVNAIGNVTLNKTNTHAESTFGQINLDDAYLTVDGLNSGNDHTDHTFAEITKDATISATNSTLADMEVSGANVTINANGDEVAFSNITLDSNTGLTLNSNSYGMTGNSLTVNGNTTTTFADTDETSDQTISLLGEVKVNGTNNVLVNNTNQSVDSKQLVFDSSSASVELNGEYGFAFSDGTSINAESTVDKNTDGDVNLGNIIFDAGDSFTLNATAGNTLINNFARNPGANINVTLNAEGGNINIKKDLETPNIINITSGDILTLEGNNSITMENVTVSGTGKLDIKNNATNISNLTLVGNAELNTTNGSISETSIDNLTVSGDGEATWKLDYDEVNKTTDTLKFREGSSNVGKIKFEIADRVAYADRNQADKYVEYIKIIDSDQRILATTTFTDEDGEVYDGISEFGKTGQPSTYYSYDDQNTENYDANTIRITNYDINSDTLLDKLTLQGNREKDFNAGKHLATTTSINAYPNMQVKAGDTENTFTIRSAYAIDGEDTVQLFTVDSTDNNMGEGTQSVNRVFNIKGASLNNALSDNTDTTRVNNGSGAALFVKSSQDTGSVTVNLTPHKANLTDSAYKDIDTANQNSYIEEKTETGHAITKDVAFTSNSSSGNGGAIYNDGVKSTINIDTLTDGGIQFTSNQSGANGGAIYNTNGATLKSEAYVTDGDNAERHTGAVTFSGNKAVGNGGAIYNDATVDIAGNAKVVNNNATGNGGAIYNKNGTITLSGETNKFDANSSGKDGGAIYNENATLTINGSNVEFTNNFATGNGGAIASVNNSLAIKATSKFSNNVALGNGGAIYLEGSEDSFDVSGSVQNNAAAGKGGAIYAKGAYDGEGNLLKATNINLTANRTSTFSGNLHKATIEGGKVISGESNAIYLDGDATINLITSTDEGKFVFQDKIASANKNNVIKQTGVAYYNNDMSGYNGTYNLQSGHAFFTDANSIPFQGGDYILNGGTTLHLNNGKISTIAANSLDLSGTSAKNPANLAVDINLTNGTADHFELNKAATGNMLISGMEIQGDPNNKKSIFVPIVTDKDAANKSKVTVESTQKVYETPGNSIYDYDILGTSASGLDNGLLFRRQALDSAFHAPQVSANARLAGQLDLMNNVLHRVDEIAENRYFHKAQRNNLYAADPDVLDDTRIDNGYTPYVNQEDGGSAWTKVYGTIETNRAVAQNYKNRAYNAFFGYETPVATLKNGWDLINTVFGGYQGSFQKYDSVENYQNGGSAGYMANLYRNNFFAGGVVMMGGTNVDVNDKGKHNRDMNYGLFDIGASVRTGYNVGMGQHWLLQPMLTTSYIFISGINRHNANGEKYDMEGTNTLQIAPGFKLVGNYSGWQPYVLLDYTWPIIAQTNASVNGQQIDHLRLKPYIEYGVGFRKNIGERFMGHAETVVRHGGRNGISFQGGLVFKF